MPLLTPLPPSHPVSWRSTTSGCSTPDGGGCRYLTWWTDGETRRRGSAHGGLRAAGVELHSRELPDFLPVVLEFAATVDLTAGLELLQQHRGVLYPGGQES
ncbi:MAG: nitrate reductase molybdenum cofactor assembly chaperone [Pseudonocardiaceae bacterium]